MGGKHLVDQESVYRRVGISNLFSFDGADWIVKRQQKNVPHDNVFCEQLHSSSLPGHIDLLSGIFLPASSFIFWLDYTNPRERLAQLQEFSQLLQKCQPGDVVRITMNAEPRTLRGSWENEGYPGPGEYRAERLKGSLGEFFPASIKKVGENEIPVTLAQAVRLAASQASASSKLNYIPILLTTYADGQRMFTATVIASDDEDKNISAGLQTWEFFPSSWTDMVDISAPDLSMREKMMIDRHLAKPPLEIIDEIGFTIAEELDEASRALESYKRLHRYYPSFYAIGLQ